MKNKPYQTPYPGYPYVTYKYYPTYQYVPVYAYPEALELIVESVRSAISASCCVEVFIC
ncbi:MAG: hypothetical protein H0Z40_09770 [Desulfotomaculum sp.]|nr:hypothetical protein [Desulfotomaculum sp.]